MRFNDSELDYLIKLLRTGGDDRVPKQALASYLVVQRASAIRQGFSLLAFILDHAALLIDSPTTEEEALTLLEQARTYRLDQPPPG